MYDLQCWFFIILQGQESYTWVSQKIYGTSFKSLFCWLYWSLCIWILVAGLTKLTDNNCDYQLVRLKYSNLILL
jgi:hypothetical protein